MPPTSDTTPPRPGLVARVLTLTPPWWGRGRVLFSVAVLWAVLIVPWSWVGETTYLSIAAVPMADGSWAAVYDGETPRPGQASLIEHFHRERSLLWCEYRCKQPGRPVLLDHAEHELLPLAPDRRTMLKATLHDRAASEGRMSPNDWRARELVETLLAGRTTLVYGAAFAAVGRATWWLPHLLFFVSIPMAMHRIPRRLFHRRILRTLSAGRCTRSPACPPGRSARSAPPTSRRSGPRPKPPWA